MHYNLFSKWWQTEITKRFRAWSSASSTAVSYLKFFSCYCLPFRWLSGTGSVPRCEGCWLVTHQHHYTLVQSGSWLTLTALMCGSPLLCSHFWLFDVACYKQEPELIEYHFSDEDLLSFKKGKRKIHPSQSVGSITAGLRNRSSCLDYETFV